MNDMLILSKTTLEFELDLSRSNKAIDRLELTNVDSQKRIGYKMKSTNVSRYLVSPSSGIIEPLKTLKVDVMLMLQPNEDTSNISDKFRLYCLEINDETVKRQNIDQYIRKNEQNIKKVSINVKIVEKLDKILGLRETPTEIQQKIEGISHTDNIQQESILFSSIEPGFTTSSVIESRITSHSFANTNLESLLIEKESDVMKLKETNIALEKDIAALRSKILPGNSVKSISKRLTADFWKIILIFLFGVIIGIYLNSTGNRMEV